jgi:glycosyltransferase involved in cell wall biosynthesis
VISTSCPRVSVVVPTRNRAHLLPGLLAALDAQTYPEYEVVVIDDASTDETEPILRRWQGPGRRVIRQEQAQGSYVARNRGWREARGELVAFTDDDCLPEPEWIAGLMRVLTTTDAVAAQGITLVGPGRVTPFTHQIEQREPGAPYRTCNIAYRRSLLLRLDGFEPLRWYADNILGFRARQIGPIGFAPDAVVYHPPRPREWRDRASWLARFQTDAIHRRFLRELGAERRVPRGRALPVLLWVVRPLLKQAYPHLHFAVRHPGTYFRDIRPLLREKVEMLPALREYWVRRELVHPQDRPRDIEPLPPLPTRPAVSVVLVTHERPALLAGTLDALSRQRVPPDQIILVDDEDAAETAEQALSVGADFVPVPPTAGLGRRRQAAVGCVYGDIVAFTDDDCLPDPGWIESLVCRFRRDPGLWGAHGRTRAERGGVGAHSIRVSRPDPLFRTCNIAYRREALERVGGFDTEFRRWFEDTALGWRVIGRGGRIGYVPEALVMHRAMPPPSFDDQTWRCLIADEVRLAASFPNLYRRYRGPSVPAVVAGRWLLGSALKAALRDLPAGMADPIGYVRAVTRTARDRAALLRLVLENRRAGRG